MSKKRESRLYVNSNNNISNEKWYINFSKPSVQTYIKKMLNSVLSENILRERMDPFVCDYLQWEINCEGGEQEILDWYCDEKNLLYVKPLTFYNKNVKRSMDVHDIFLIRKYKKLSLIIAGPNCIDLFYNLDKLYKGVNKENAFKLKRIDIKLQVDTDLSVEDIRKEHIFLKKGCLKIEDQYFSSLGITSNFLFNKGKGRVYNYFDENVTNVEFEFRKKGE